jgi:hypothetical protein
MPSEGAKRLQTRARLLAFSLNIRAYVNIYMYSLQCPREPCMSRKLKGGTNNFTKKDMPVLNAYFL